MGLLMAFIDACRPTQPDAELTWSLKPPFGKNENNNQPKLVKVTQNGVVQYEFSYNVGLLTKAIKYENTKISLNEAGTFVYTRQIQV